jgi:hypothetical protein
MAFQVTSNVAALNVYNNLSVHQAKSSASLARISSGLKAAGGGDVASQGTAATLNAALQGTQSSISQVQSAINQLQAADAAYGELIALGQKGLEVSSRGADAGADASALFTQLTALTAGITSIQTNTEFNGVVFTTASAPNVGVAAFTATPTVAAAPTLAAPMQPLQLLQLLQPAISPPTLLQQLIFGPRMQATLLRCRTRCRCSTRWQQMS